MNLVYNFACGCRNEFNLPSLVLFERQTKRLICSLSNEIPLINNRDSNIPSFWQHLHITPSQTIKRSFLIRMIGQSPVIEAKVNITETEINGRFSVCLLLRAVHLFQHRRRTVVSTLLEIGLAVHILSAACPHFSVIIHIEETNREWRLHAVTMAVTSLELRNWDLDSVPLMEEKRY